MKETKSCFQGMEGGHALQNNTFLGDDLAYNSLTSIINTIYRTNLAFITRISEKCMAWPVARY